MKQGQLTIFELKEPIAQVSPAIGEEVFVVGRYWEWVPAKCVGWEHFDDIDKWFPVLQEDGEPRSLACRFPMEDRFYFWCFALRGEPEIPKCLTRNY